MVNVLIYIRISTSPTLKVPALQGKFLKWPLSALVALMSWKLRLEQRKDDKFCTD